MKKLKRLVQAMLTPLPSPLKVPIYRLMGARIAKGASIAPFTLLLADSLTLGSNAKIKPLSMISCRQLMMGTHSGISNLCIINGNSDLRMAARAFIGPGCMVDLHAPVTMGEYTGLGPRSSLMTHGTFWPTAWGYRNKEAPVEIGDFVWIANDCRIAPGIKIANHSMVMTATNVSRDISNPSLIVFSCDEGHTPQRTQLPLSLFQQKLTPDFRANYLRKVAQSLYDDLLISKGYKIHKNTNHFLFEKGRQSVAIFFDAVNESNVIQPRQRWLWGYALSSTHHQTDYVLFDFHTLLTQGRDSSIYRAALKYLKSRWGNIFIDYKDQTTVKIEPPPLIP